MKHQKHAKLQRPNFGFFGRNEWAIIGTPCGAIQQLSYQLTTKLAKQYKVAYVDAEHAVSTADDNAIKAGASFEYTDKISHHQFALQGNLDVYHYRQHFNEQDLVLVNGNHFKAKKQIVVIDPKKEESLSRKLDRLTDVDLILLKEASLTIYDFLKDHLENWSQIPVLPFDDLDGIFAFLAAQMEASIPPVYGLVLAGGKSMRMGTDKGAIAYHGKAQREYAADLLKDLGIETYLSVRSEQLDQLQTTYSVLPDKL